GRVSWRLELPRSNLSRYQWTLVTRAPSSPDKPRVGITLGDLAGIGPEIVLKAVVDADVCAVCSPVIIGPLSELQRQAAALSLSADFPLYVTGQSSLCSSAQPSIFDTGAISERVPWGAV